MTDRPVIHLVDGSGYVFRAFFAIRPLSTRAGLPTNAVFGFARMFGKLVKDERPRLLGVAFDAGRTTFRHEIYPDYKANREEPPAELVPQFSLIRELVTAMDVPVFELDGYEADDLLATLADRAVARGCDVVVVSGDKDLLQLVSPGVSMYDPMKDKRYARADVVERFGVPPELVADVLALAGDASDNIPGVPKVGEKTAARLVAAHGDVEAVIAALGEPGRKLKAAELSVVEHAEAARLSKRLATLRRDAPVTLDLERLRYAAPRAERLAPFLRRIEASGLLRELALESIETPCWPEPAAGDAPDAALGRGVEHGPAVDPAGSAAPAGAGANADALAQPAMLDPAAQATRAGGGQQALRFDRPVSEMAGVGPTAGTTRAGPPSTPPAGVAPREPGPIDQTRYRTVDDGADLAAVVALIKARRELALSLETASPSPDRDEVIGIALAAGDMPPVYVPVAHRYLGAPKQTSFATALDCLRPLFEDPEVAKFGHDLKHEALVLSRAAVELRGITDDAMVAAYVLDPSRPSYSTDALAREVLGHEVRRRDDVVGKGRQRVDFAEVDIEAATRHAAENADLALRLCHALSRRVDEAGLTHLYRDLELPLVPVLAEMERAGIRVDPGRLRELGREFASRLAAIEDRAAALIGEKVNLASPKQLQELLFVKLGLKAERRTKTGYSTDQEVLEALAREHEVPRIILEHRLLAKLKGTYVDALARTQSPTTGRVHTRFNQTGAATGRLSSSDPNLQNIPVRSDDGRRIRAAFVAEPGHVLISADYSQIELRVMAHLSGDESFIQAFAHGEDIHQRTAQEILTGGLPPDPEARRRAKAINFGILYGLSEYGLSRQLGIPRAEAQAYIAAYFGRYPRIRRFLDETIETARRVGYVTTLAGRRRYLPDLNSKNRTVRQGAERVAMNTPIQGSAADLIKLAMLRVSRSLRERRLRARLLLQVHDELVLEAPAAERDAVKDLVREAMAGVRPLRVALVVDVGEGPDWATAH